MASKNKTQRLSSAEKNANKKQWYKDQANAIIREHLSSYTGVNKKGPSNYHKMKTNYNLMNNILDLKDFQYVYNPLGTEDGELPATMSNKDIISNKVKAMLGMEMKRPFSWKVFATNSEATTRKEKEKYDRVKQYVIETIMAPVKLEIEKANQIQQGKEVTSEQQEEIQKKIAEETEAKTPPEIQRYMEREHQDPAEMMCTQLLNYLIQEKHIKNKFNEGFKHLNIAAGEFYFLPILRDEPDLWVVNPLNFSYSTNETGFIEDGEWAGCVYKMSPSTIIERLGDELTADQMDQIYDAAKRGFGNEDEIFREWEETSDLTVDNSGALEVEHTVWKSLRKIRFLTSIDEEEEESEEMVDESYKLNQEAGDISIRDEWIPEVYEAWKILDFFVYMRPFPGQFKDINNLYHCKLPYYGATCDSMNATPTSLVDRLKTYQYFYNIIMYRIELLIASDRGKKVLMDINIVPDSKDFDLEKFMYYFTSTPFAFFNSKAEGSVPGDANSMAKVLDLSLISDIKNYVDLAQNIKTQAGLSVGIPETMEGQISASAEVGNTRQSILQSSNALEPYFDLHSIIKRNVLQGLIEVSKVAYSNKTPEKLSYVLDDLSLQLFALDPEMLDNNTLGLFVSNSAKMTETIETIKQSAFAAMQNNKIELSDLISIYRQESLIEVEETLLSAEDKRKKTEAGIAQQAQEAQAKQVQQMQELEEQKHKWALEEIVTKEEENRKTELAKAFITGASFNPDKDVDVDKRNDFIEEAKSVLEEKKVFSSINLDKEKLAHQKNMDERKMRLEEKTASEKSKQQAQQQTKQQ